MTSLGNLEHGVRKLLEGAQAIGQVLNYLPTYLVTPDFTYEVQGLGVQLHKSRSTVPRMFLRD